MKKTHFLLVMVLASTSLFAQKANVELKNSLDSTNYAYGMNIGSTVLRTMDKDLNANVFLAGLQAILNGTAAKITNDEATRRVNEYNTTVSQPRISGRWKDENATFLVENKKRPGVITTPSGLQYEILTKGTGTVSPMAVDNVEVHYHGTLIDGQIFDSSVQRNKTASFALNRVIPGWTEGLQYMKAGDKFKFYIPYNLGYGEAARQNSIIKGFSTLIFEVELFKVTPAASAPTAAPSGADKAAGEAFLAENKKRPGVITTPSGLQYEILTKGKGTASPKATDKVEVHYHGTTIEGKVFDSSVQRGETITFPLNGVIKGWTEGVQLMKIGDKFKFFIPNELAYGNQSPTPDIRPGAALIFEVELFKINAKGNE